jgi:hypothetical protein
VVRGKHVPVDLILRKLGAGASEAEIFADHPMLTHEDILAAQAFAIDDDPLEILGAYLHQDWNVLYPNFRVALLRLFHDEPRELTKPLMERAKLLIEGPASESEIDAVLCRYVDYAYGRAGMTAREFLTELLTIANLPR